MEWLQRNTRLRVLIIIVIIVISLMIVFIYGTTPATSSGEQATPNISVWILLLLFLLGVTGIFFQIIGLIGLFMEKRWSKHIFSVSVVISAIISIINKSGVGGSSFLATLGVCYWLIAGAIIALSYEKQKLENVTQIDA